MVSPVFFRNACVEILMPNVMVLGGIFLGQPKQTKTV